MKAWAGDHLASPRGTFSSLLTLLCLGVPPDKNGELDFSTFLTIMHMQMKQEDPKKEILLAMLMADKEKKGYIMASELRSKLMKLGEKLTHKEGNGLIPLLPQQQEMIREFGGRLSKPNPCHQGCAGSASNGCLRRP